MAKQKYYVVWVGRKAGIFTDWATTQKSIIKFPGAQFKSFPTRAEAEEAFQGGGSSGVAKERSGPATVSAPEYEVQIYCDGGCEPNPGKAASGIAVYRSGVVSELYYGLYNPMGTNNTAELNALHQSLLIAEKELNKGKTVQILCDSLYSINCIATWAAGWEKKGWKKAGGEIKNLDIIKKAYVLYNRIKSKMTLSHIKAHAGTEGNELADRMTMVGVDRKDKKLCLYDEELDIERLLSMRAG